MTGHLNNYHKYVLDPVNSVTSYTLLVYFVSLPVLARTRHSLKNSLICFADYNSVHSFCHF